MRIDDTIIKEFLTNQEPTDYSDHWIFSTIEKGRNLFERPKPSESQSVAWKHKSIVDATKNLVPLNPQFVAELFPDFNTMAENTTLILSVGCPDPYDAMVLEHDGDEYMVFDLIQFAPYAREGEHDLGSIARRVLTHELVHVCLHRKYACVNDLSYIDTLSYKTFDEGFAHVLSYTEDILSCEFNEALQKRFDVAKNQLKNAIQETTIKKQAEYLSTADTGEYWDKFASISGSLYLLKNIHELNNIYQSGWQGFVKTVLE